MMSGVREEAAEFRRDEVLEGLGRFRRFAENAPLYEVLEISGDRARIELVESREIVNVRLSDVLDSIVAT